MPARWRSSTSRASRPSIRAAGLPPERSRASSSGRRPWRARRSSGACPGAKASKRAEVTPVRACLCAQDYLEPVLRRCAERQPGRAALQHRAHGVRAGRIAACVATLASTGDGRDRTDPRALPDRGRRRAEPHARGARHRACRARRTSTTASTSCSRPICGRGRRTGRPRSTSSRTKELRGTFMTINAHDRWGFLVNSLKAHGSSREDFTPERSAELIRRAVGVPTCR